MAVALLCWWLLAVVVVASVQAAGVLRLFLALLMPLSLPSLFRFAWLLGPRAIRVIEWNAQGEFLLGLGSRRQVAARLVGRQRLGLGLWALDFHSSEGRFGVLVDTGLQPLPGIRRLGRALERGDLLPSRPKV